MKEKKMVACVVLGVSIVSLISLLVVAFAESLNLLINFEYYVDQGGVTLGGVLLGTAFLAVFFANKKYRFAVNLGLAVTVVVYCVVSLIVLELESHYNDSYLATAITLMVSCTLTFAAWLYLTLIKKNEGTSNDSVEL